LANKKIVEWIIDNLAWELVVVVFVSVFLRFLPDFIQAIRISKKILKSNRDTRGNSWGKYSADRFIDVWYSNPRRPLRYERGRFYYKTFNNPNSRHWMDVIDGEHVQFGLIEIFNSPQGYEEVRPVKTWRNTVVAYLVKWYLIKFIGDNQQYYKGLEEQSRR